MRDTSPFASEIGVENVETDVEQKRVVVTGTASTDEMIAAVKKTGKECRLWDQ